MQTSTHSKYLIIGQGLAGSILAWKLSQSGQSVHVIDNNHRTSSSIVAAGMINPLAGLRYSRPEHMEYWLDSAFTFYEDISIQLGLSIIHKKDMVRIFFSEKQISAYQRQKEKLNSDRYFGESFAHHDNVKAPLGGFMQQETGYIEIKPLLAAIKSWLIENKQYSNENLNCDQISIEEHCLRIGQYSADNIIFCEGYQLKENPWFNYLPLTPDKGEMLTFKGDLGLSDHIINGAYWLIPTHNGDYRFGATHEHDQLDEKNTKEKRKLLDQGLSGLINTADQAIDIKQIAGVRPATQDRMPLIGTHNSHKNLHVFNGFGARGSLTIPYYAQILCDNLTANVSLPIDANIKRFD